MPPSLSWGRRFKGSPYFNFAATNQHTTSTDSRLFGGTAFFMAPAATARTSDYGQDPTGLGRWTWVTIAGRRGITSKVITGYRPVRDFSNRPGTVYSQHEKFFHEQGQPREPRQAFLEDLEMLIRSWQSDGHHIVLGLDLNEYIFSPVITTWASNLGLIPALSQHHPHLPQVATCDKSQHQRPIDGIWITPGLEITNCGMSGFGDIATGSSDHRLLWVDLDECSLLGYTPQALTTRSREIFSIHDPMVVRRYNNYLRRQRAIHRIPSKLTWLQVKAQQGTFSHQDQLQYEQLCKLDDGLRHQAKRKSRRFYAGQVLYSDIIGFDYHELRLWQLILKRLSGHRTDTRHIRRLMQRTGQTTALQMSQDEAQCARQQCYRRYLKHKKDQHNLREQFEKRQAQRIADAKGIPLEAQVKMQKNTRQIRGQFAHIRAIINAKPKVLLHTVEYTDPGSNTVECLNRTDVEDACQTEGEQRFAQAHGTPFLQGSLLRDLGFLANQHATDQILMGTYQCDTDIDIFTRMFISELKLPTEISHLPAISGICCASEHASAWTKMKANTASSPFGPLFADYIAGTKNLEVALVDNQFSSIPIQAGFCPEPWVKAVDIMIPKKQSSINVNKLRIIVLFHAMFNMINKRVGRRMIHRALEYNEIPIEAFGSVPGKQASVCVLNKALVNDVLRQQRRPAAICSNDAASCYDRIVHVVASLCMQRLGVDANTCKVMFGTLQQLQHYVATAYGVSASAYGGLHIPLQGVGQGNGAGPAIWLVMTIPLINMLRRQGFGFHSISPITQHHCHLACFTYVDDTDTVHAPLDHTITAAQVNMEMQQAIDIWAGGLHATGGVLAPEKSYWYLLDFFWHKPTLTWRYKSVADIPGQLHFKSPEGRPTALVRHDPNTAVETLGIPLAMDGNQTAIVASLQAKISKWASKIQTRQLTRRETLLSLHSGLSKSLDYPLVATRLTKQQCNALMRPLRQAALPVLGIPSTFPTILVHSPREFLGLGFPNLWFEQGFAQIGCMLRHYHDIQHDSTAQLYRHAVEGMKMELGLPGFPLSYDYYKFNKCTTPTQLHIAWQFCTDLGLTLKDGGKEWQVPRENDMSLMEFFAQAGFSAKELRYLNLCRLHLHVLYISDLCTGDGLSLDAAHIIRRTPFEYHTDLHWPQSGTPNKTCWSMWDQALTQLVHHDNRLAPRRLKQPLGKWIRVPPGWPNYIDPQTNQLYKRTPYNTFLTALPTLRRYGTRNVLYRQTDEAREAIPPGALPTTITTRGTSWTHSGSQTIAAPHPLAPSEWYCTIIRRPAHLQHLLRGLETGTAIVVTDGSYKDGLGTAAFALRATMQDHDGIDAVNMTPGEAADMDPYRAELGGIYGSLRLVHILTDSYSITSGKITLACDCSAALQRLMQTTLPRTDTPHYDLLMACRDALAQSPLKWEFQHVRGHQDAHRSYTLLDRVSQLNVDMDSLAKSYWQLLNSQRPPTFSLPPSEHQLSLWRAASRLTSWNRTKAQQVFYNRSTIPFWTDRMPLPQPHVDWEACGMALRRATIPQQLWIPRWLTSFLPTGNRARYIPTATTDLCPRCNNPELHRYHIIRCPHPGATLKWQQSLNNLESWLVTQHTKPALTNGIVSLLRAWYGNQNWNTPISLDTADRAAFRAQQQAGITTIFDGGLVQQWAAVQHQYYIWLNRRTTGKRWLSRLILKLWEIAWDLWSHRYKVMTAPDSMAIARLHADVDDAIVQAYDTFTPQPPLPLARWFARPLPSILSESLDFKRQWLEMITALTSQNHHH